MRGELALSLVRYAPGAVLGEHSHARGSISIVVGGALLERVGSETALARMGHAVVKPPELPHSNRFGSQGGLLISVADPPGVAFERGWRWLAGHCAGRRAIAIAAALTEGDPFGEAQEQGWELVASVSRGAARSLAAPPEWVNEVKDRVAAAPRRPSLARLADTAGVHPAYLTKAFRAAFGYSISGFIRRLRSQRAADLLAQSDLGIAAIAAQTGFADQSHLCRIFRRELGVSPSAYRLLVTGRRATGRPCNGSR